MVLQPWKITPPFTVLRCLCSNFRTCKREANLIVGQNVIDHQDHSCNLHWNVNHWQLSLFYVRIKSVLNCSMASSTAPCIHNSSKIFWTMQQSSSIPLSPYHFLLILLWIVACEIWDFFAFFSFDFCLIHNHVSGWLQYQQSFHCDYKLLHNSFECESATSWAIPFQTHFCFHSRQLHKQFVGVRQKLKPVHQKASFEHFADCCQWFFDWGCALLSTVLVSSKNAFRALQKVVIQNIHDGQIAGLQNKKPISFLKLFKKLLKFYLFLRTSIVKLKVNNHFLSLHVMCQTLSNCIKMQKLLAFEPRWWIKYGLPLNSWIATCDFDNWSLAAL